MQIHAIAYDPHGKAIAGAVGKTSQGARKALRRMVANQKGAKWHVLWLKGYRVKGVR